MKIQFFFKNIIVLFVFGMGYILLLAMSVNAQDSPGGITPSYFLRANTNTKMVVVVGSISSWDTEVGASYSLTQGVATRMPTLNSGSTDFNYNPCVQFDGLNDQLSRNTSPANDLFNGNSGTLFIVANHGTVFNTTFTYRRSGSTARLGMKLNYRVQTGLAGIGYVFDTPPPTQYSQNSSYMVTVKGAGPTFSINKNSVPYTLFSTTGTGFNPAISTGMFMGANNSTEFSDQSVAEVIMYDSPLSALSISRVESYLALKYGITRNGNGVGANYIASDGTTVFWDNLTNSGYNNDIAGLGRDDLSGLNQLQSKSVNDGEPVTIGLGSIAPTNSSNLNTFSSNGSFLTWGNDGQLIQTIFGDPACYSNLPAGVQAKIKRVWKTQLTNFTQDVTIDFESSLLVNFLPISNLRLLIDNDGSDWTDATVVSGATLNGTRIEFAGINFNTLSKKYFTLATIDAINTPLPVYLISLIGESIERNNKISWTINPKEDVDHYIIEKSYNNNFTEFASIASSDSRVNQSNTLDYQWLDMNVSENMSYYKLKVVYSEGRTESLGIVSVKNKPTRMVTFSPNPVSDILTLKFAGESQYPSKIDIINQNGKVVYTTEEIDSVNIALNIGSLCSGFYYFSLTYEDSIVIEKFIKID